MSDTTLPTKGLPAAVVADKGFGRSVSLAITDANHITAHGFDVNYPASIHFRTLKPGAFSVLVGTRLPVEVQVIMDGVLHASQICDPSNVGSSGGADTAVRRNVRELVDKPQAFFISTTDDGTPLQFSKPAESGEESRTQRLRQQLFPLLTSAPLQPLRTGQPGDALPVEDDLRSLVAPPDIPLNWASSRNLIGVGIRMIQVSLEGEPNLPQDVFSYVLFQLNDWNDNAWVRANSHSHIILPPDQYKELDDGTIVVAEPAGGCGNIFHLK